MALTAPGGAGGVDSVKDQVISVKDLRKTYRAGQQVVTALDGISLSVKRGDILVLMGVSGSGKSTLIGILGSLLRPESGEVEVAGKRVGELSRADRAEFRRKTASLVFQEYNLISLLTATENVSLPLELSGMNRRQAQDHARAKLDDLGLGDQAGRFPGELSGGQRQRVAIARALAGDHPVLLADEPTGSLDSHTAAALRHTFVAAAEAGVTVVIGTHDPKFVDIASNVVQLRDGKIVPAQAA